jgi:hypothetical protein
MVQLQKEHHSKLDMTMAVVMQSYHSLRDISINLAKVHNFTHKNLCLGIMQGLVRVQRKMALLEQQVFSS